MPDDLNIDQLIENIRAEAAQPPYSNEALPDASAPPGARQLVNLASAPIDSMRPAPQHIDELFAAGDDLQFVNDVYLALLNRPADAVGLSTCLELLSAGNSRLHVFGLIRHSPEAHVAARTLRGERGALRMLRTLNALRRKVVLVPLAQRLEQLYYKWCRVRLAVSGRAIRRLAILQSHAERQLLDIQRLSAARDLRVDQVEAELRAIRHQRDADHQRALRHQGMLATLDAHLGRNDNRVLLPPETALSADPQTAALPPQSASESALTRRIDAYYCAFEDAHRGTEASIRDKLFAYLAHLATLPESLLRLPAVDIGCGRGEWLGLLRENGFQAYGVDLNADMVGRCRSLGLEAHHADALAWLAHRPSESCSVVSAFHLIEHLPFELLFQMVEQAWRVLAPGGLLIFETPNPENVLVGSHTFYHDFSHKNPITPVSLRFLITYNGFDVVDMPRFCPYPPEDRLPGQTTLVERFNGHFYGPQDYGIVARKPAIAGGAGV